MEKGNDTGFKDKTNRVIHINDIVQYRLGKFGKSGGTENFKVIQFGNKYKLINEFQVDSKLGGIVMTQVLCKYLVVIRCDHIRN